MLTIHQTDFAFKQRITNQYHPFDTKLITMPRIAHTIEIKHSLGAQFWSLLMKKRKYAKYMDIKLNFGQCEN